MAELDPIEKKLFLEFADDYDTALGNASCNDFKWPEYVPSAKRKEIIDKINERQAPEDKLNYDGNYTMDYIVFLYLTNKIMS